MLKSAGFSFCMKYSKPHLPYEDQVNLLIQRGLDCPDRGRALLWLKRIGYQCVRTLAGSVDDGKVCASLGGGFEYLAQSGNLTGDNGGRFLASPVAPIRGGRLRVKVDHGNRTASQNRLYGYP
jgi:hypothetical protein